MIDDEDMSAETIAVILGHGVDEATEFINDAAEMVENFGYDLDYEVRLSNKTNPNTGKPYKNTYYSIAEVFDM